MFVCALSWSTNDLCLLFSVIFITKELLTYLGLPASSMKELYSSPLIHADLLDCISAGDKQSTKSLRNKIKKAINAEESISEVVSLKLSAGWGLFPVSSLHRL